MAERAAITVLAEELGRALQPLVEATSSDAALHDFLADLGWELSPVPPAVASVRAPAQQVYSLVAGSDEIADADVPALFNGLRATFTTISDIAGAGGLPPGFANAFPRELVDYLVVEYLLNQHPRWGYLLRALGVIRVEEVAAAAGRPAHLTRTVAYEAFGRIADEPLAFFHDAYRWNQTDFRGEDLAFNFFHLLQSWGLDVVEDVVDPVTLLQLTVGALNPAATEETVVKLVLLRSESAVEMELGAALFLLPQTATHMPGFSVLPYGTEEFREDVPLAPAVTAKVDGTVAVTDGPGALVRPGDVAFQVGFGSAAGPRGAGGTLTIGVLAEGDEPMTLVGATDASRFEVGGASALAGTRFYSNGGFEIFTEFAVEGARIVIKPAPGEGDGFLTRLLPSEGLSLETDLTVGFSTTQGLYFGGSSGLEIAIPAHVQLGPLEIQSALVSVRPAAGAIPITFAVTVKGELGVVKAVVENVGLTATLTFPDDRNGNLGPVDLALGFRPPNGVGLAIDAGVVKGGGYLFFDQTRGQYAGTLTLSVGFLSLTAIGLIDTRLPGGETGFSLLVVITAEFNPGIQLGFGFTLSGVGGILGLHRVLLLEPLLAGVRTGAVNSILFPRDVVANAPRILSDLRTIFPPQQGTFLVGPMAKIGWGTPTLISVSLGVVVEIPGNVVALGRLRLVLPTEEAAVVVLQVTFVGALESERRRIWFFATLFESRVLFVTLDGEMGLLMDFGDRPEFLLSVGGFHPRFSPPPLPFPAPARLQLAIVNESFARVRAETYVAVTSNTVQLGCNAEAYFGFDAFSVEGHLSFDALLRFSPFYLIVEVSSGFSVKVFGAGVWGVHLRGTMEGPTPWRVRGSAEIDILFFSFDVDVDVTFGDRRHDVLPPIAVLPQIQAEFEKLESWRATLPASGRLFVSLRELGAADTLVLHPVGTLQISQRFAPLNLPLDRIGQQKPSDVNRVTVSAESASLAVRGPVREKFAVAQYRDMDDAAKLSAPSFEPLDAGIELGASGNAWTTGPLAQRNVRYEQIIIDTPPERPRKGFYAFPNGLFVHFRAGAAIYRSAPSLANEKRLEPFADKVTVSEDSYTVAFQADNRATSTTATFASFAEAESHLGTVVRGDPNLADALHVIPGAEVNVEA